MKSIFLALALTLFSTDAFAERGERWTSRREVQRATKALANTTTRLVESFRRLGDTNLRNFCDENEQMARLASELLRVVDNNSSYSSCDNSFMRIRKVFRELRDDYQRKFRTHEAWQVAYSWLRVEEAFIDLHYAMRQSRMDDRFENEGGRKWERGDKPYRRKRGDRPRRGGRG